MEDERQNLEQNENNQSALQKALVGSKIFLEYNGYIKKESEDDSNSDN